MNEEEIPNGESLNVQKEETKKKESPEGKKMKLRKIIKKQILPVTESSDQSEQDGKSWGASMNFSSSMNLPKTFYKLKLMTRHNKSL